tara:strand:+ start:1202 stop:2701 length:1500 start_codon:yes stop_codon:yes gene_type:complete
MSKLEVDKVVPQSGTTLTVGEAGDTTVINGLGTLPATIGTATQVLAVNAGATGLEYGTAATDLSNLNATNLTSGTVPDLRFPSVLPAAGAQNLTSLQSAALTGALPAISGANLTNLPSQGIVWQTTPKTATFIPADGEGYFINSGSAITANLPAGVVGAIVAFSDYARNFSTYNLTISPNGSEKIGGIAADLTLSVNGQALTLVYVDATKGWINVQNAEDTETGLVVVYNIDIMTLAGGGGGGMTPTAQQGGGGGGGAGGLLYSTSISVDTGTVYTADVGAGGPGMVSDAGAASSGSDSIFSGGSISTITAAGGGGGGGNAVCGVDGGSGGGGNGAACTAGANGTIGQGNDAGNGANGGGGGGGKGGVGSNSSVDVGGAGGAGGANSITGAAITYAGGGGAGGYRNPGNGGAGGSSIGGAGGDSGNGNNASANLGSGGGGAYGPPSAASGFNGGNGSDGLIILRVLTSDYSGTTTGSPSVSVDGSHTVIQFTGDGTYTG